MAIHILGIRHHGPGSARNVKEYLEEHKPDIVLVEGPPDADALLDWATHKDLKPPVSILVYQPDDSKKALFYPFAEFSPEWQAILYAKKNNIPVRFMDLPLLNYFALGKQMDEEGNEEKPIEENNVQEEEIIVSTPEELLIPQYRDPISYLAEADGFGDSEKWWEHHFEYRMNNEQVFEAVAEAMKEVRDTITDTRDGKREALREAYMRKIIRQAEKEQYQNIAVICGAWHAPALADLSQSKEDNDLLKGLPKVKVECTWTPWTYGRLSVYSGYGAGIESPGWYHHLWKHPKDNGTRWIVMVAKLLRKKQMDVSVAHVIEAVRLAETLAILRNLHKPGLEEMNEAVLTVLCNGESILFSLIQNELIVSNRIGAVPSETPKPPLQIDIENFQKKLRLPPTAEPKEYVLDLRKDTDLAKSVFLHRLQLLDIAWGRKQQITGKGTFKEQWTLQWEPSLAIDIIEKGSWGNTVLEAVDKYIIYKTNEADSLQVVSHLLEETIPAELPASIENLIAKINNLAAATGDVIQLMEVVPGMVAVSRYGNVRKTDAEMVLGIVRSMVTRILVSLPVSCVSVNEDAAAHLLNLFQKLNDSINILNDPLMISEWQRTLSIIMHNPNSSPVIGGYATRLLYDSKTLEGDALVQTFSYNMSSSAPPAQSAAWLEGFLKGSGTVLLIDQVLWQTVNNWVATLDKDMFTQLLPLLRRTFSEFTQPERKKLGEKAKAGDSTPQGRIHYQKEITFDEERAAQGIPVVVQLLGIQ